MNKSLKKWCEENKKETILNEWCGFYSDDFRKPTSPTKVSFTSNVEAVWKCQKCGYRIKKSIKERLANDKLDCPNCRKIANIIKRSDSINSPHKEITLKLKCLKSSIPEAYLSFYLKMISPDLEIAKRFFWLGRFSLDIFLPSLSLGIEYDGAFWHEDRSYNDSFKSDLCKEHGISLIRIREGGISNFDKTAIEVLYNQNRDYSNIGEPISEIVNYINQKYKMSIAIDINIERDFYDIYEYVLERFHKRTLSYIWPEIKDYWMYDKNSGIRPEDVIINDAVPFLLKCPQCGKEFPLQSNRYIDFKSMPSFCGCYWGEPKIELYRYAKDYYDKYGNLDLDDSLESRRVYDWLFNSVLRFHWQHIPKDERDMFRLIGIDITDDMVYHFVSPIFREENEEDREFNRIHNV